ncbi:hypothetical protein ABT025_29585 [Streptomyces sp. NPDC002809]|uniref:hypothetical protein n=1 Tax=Streptomyces sp. NPDC002809 TaxID=3154433 RepID=UPI00331BD46F
MFRDHQELDVTVIAVAAVGSKVDANGETGFIDQVKHPSWWDESSAPPRAGDRLHVVVLDASREEPRFSALQLDIDIARRLRDAGGACRGRPSRRRMTATAAFSKVWESMCPE